MAIAFPWMEAAYKGAMGWNVSDSQANPDRGAYKDALQASTASKYVDFRLGQGMLRAAADTQTRLMDADARNTKGLMTAEHGFKLRGMQESNRLSKDYLTAQTASDMVKLRGTGEEERATVRTTGQEQRETVRTTGQEQRANTRVSGEEERETVRTTAGEQRRNLEHDRTTAFQLARQGLRRA